MSERAFRILVVEDDVSILSGLSINLKFEGYEILQAQDGRRGLERALDEEPDLLVLDVMLPELNGFEVVKELRERGRQMPVVMLSAKGQEQDKVLAFNLGADDYVVKPFGLAELLARIKAVLRRRYPGVASSKDARVRFGSVEVDLSAKSVLREGHAVELTAQEFKLLAHFIGHAGRTFSREELLLSAWGYHYEGSARTVDNFLRQLRLKLEQDAEAPRHFLTVRGLGYRFER